MCSSCNDVFDSDPVNPVPPPDVNNMAIAAVLIFAFLFMLQSSLFSRPRRKRKAKS